MLLSIYFLIAVFSLTAAKNEDYKGYMVYKIKLDTEIQQSKFYEIESDVIDFWRKPNFKHDVTGLIMVPPSHFEWFDEKIKELNVAKDIYAEDVFEYLTEKENSLTRTLRNEGERVFDFEGFYRYQEIQDYIHALRDVYANSESISVQVVDFGITSQGRSLTYLKINSLPTANNKPVVIIEAGASARDWITVPAALNAALRALDTENSRLLDNFEWIIIPVLNPDGYEYSHSTRRVWIKSRRAEGILGFLCPGININRNFDVDWLNFDSSSSACSDMYAGPEAFSEIESQLVKTLLEEYGNRIGLYVSLQSDYGLISYPWHYENAASGMFIQHHRLGMQMVGAMQDSYEIDIASTALGRASGTSTDYLRENGVLYTYNVGIKTEDGIHVAENQIASVVADVWRAISVAADSVV